MTYPAQVVDTRAYVEDRISLAADLPEEPEHLVGDLQVHAAHVLFEAPLTACPPVRVGKGANGPPPAHALERFVRRSEPPPAMARGRKIRYMRGDKVSK